MLKAENRKPMWRIWVFCAAVAVIVWMNLDTAGKAGSMTPAEAMPVLLVNLCVTGGKVLLMAGALRLIRWITEKIRK